MKYQLVLQWPCQPGAADYDQLVSMEEAIAECLSSESEVDGHDIGSGEMNIFVLTDEPILSFERIKEVLGKYHAWTDVRIAYREASGDMYTILWPAHLTEFRVA
jgi:hypothetical protein